MNPVSHITLSDGKTNRAINKNFSLVSNTDRSAVFTTFSSFYHPWKGHLLPLFERHLERLVSGSREMKILNSSLDEHKEDYIRARLLAACQDYKNKHQLPDPSQCLKARLVISPSGLEIYLTAVESHWFTQTPVSLVTYSETRPNPEVKHVNLEVNLRAADFASKKGADHALLVTDQGLVQECDWANIFWHDSENNLFSSKLNSLPGIIQQLVARSNQLQWAQVHYHELLEGAHTIFISKGTTGLNPVSEINDMSIKFDKSLYQDIVERLMPEFLDTATSLEIKI